MKSNFEWVKQFKDEKSGWFDRINRAEELIAEKDPIGLVKLGYISEVLAKELILRSNEILRQRIN